MKTGSNINEKAKVRILVDKNVVETNFEKWANPGHFSRTLAKGPKTPPWLWNFMILIFKLNH